MPGKTEIPLFRPGDIVLLLLLLVPVLLTVGGRSGGESDSATVVVTDGGEYSVPTGCDSVFSVDGHLGEMVLETSDGRIRVRSSPCPGQHCVDRGWAESAGDVIVCIPSAVYIRVDPSGAGSVDAVSY